MTDGHKDYGLFMAHLSVSIYGVAYVSKVAFQE